MMYQAGDFYSYFKECYRLDYNEFVVDNVLSTKHKFKWFVSGNEELLNDSLPYLPYFNNKIEDLEKEIELFKLEKQLFYAAFFVLGKNTNPLVRDKRFCAPLLLFPAEIIEVDDEKFIEIDRNSVIVNRSVLTHLDIVDESLSKDQFINELSDMIDNQDSNMMMLNSLMTKYYTNINAEEVLLYPKVWSVSKLRKYFSESSINEGNFVLVPAAGTFLAEYSESTLKINNDLSGMIQDGSYNSSLTSLFKNGTEEHKIKQSIYKHRLNVDQGIALDNTYRYQNSVIVGPPGTGKSYTITSIVADLIANNQSVLVVSKTKQAVEVLRHMLQEDFKLKEFLIHTSGNKYKMSLKAKISRYLYNIRSRSSSIGNDMEIFLLYKSIHKLESKFEKLIERELRIFDLEFANKEMSIRDKWAKLYLNSSLINGEKLWDVYDEIERANDSLDKEISIFTKRKIQDNINKNISKYRRDLSMFYDALCSDNFTEYKSLLNKVKHKNILKVFPIWLANLGDLNSVLPLEKDLFDVVIMDEATQCDVATALPAIFRAKRCVIVGDPNQLRHYSFVSKSRQIELQKTYHLSNDKMFDYRNRSILDLYLSKVEKQEQISFLREHFRSTPAIIEFSNEKFYDGQLEVLRSTPKQLSERQVELVEIQGNRNSKGINELEAKAVVDRLDEFFKSFDDEKRVPSIGIISPFSSQVTYISKLIKERFTVNQLKKFDVLCGTPYSFQGSEREIILLSFCVCDHTHSSAFNHVNKAEVMNVGITRAKSYQVVFKSVSDKNLKEGSLLAEYFEFIKSSENAESDESEKDEFQNEVIRELEKLNYTDIKCGYPIAGNVLDILVSFKGRNYFIDLIGYPGIHKKAFTLERYKTLGRTGIKTLPLHYSYWKKNKKKAIIRLVKFIKSKK